MNGVLLSIWRPEASGGPDLPHEESPFDGIETYLIDGDDEATGLVVTLAEEHPHWKFHIEPLRKWFE